MVPLSVTFFLIHEKYSCGNLHDITVNPAIFGCLPKESATAFLAQNSPYGFVD
jgi:hypothetical protein